MKSIFSSLVAGLLISTPAFAAWTLQPEQSQLFFSSIKKETVAETHQFKSLQGTVSDSGEFSVTIDLSSAETGIPIRNERLAQYLFETSKFAQASAKGQVDLKALGQQAIGNSQTVKLPIIFELHGKTITKEATLQLIQTSANQVTVSTPAPIFLNAADFDLLPGIEKLKELAALPSISPLVPVSFHLQFKQEAAKKK